jgi:deoxyribodipyrimidine photo-lyase
MTVDDSSKLSPWLAWGVLSPRRVYVELQKLKAHTSQHEGIHALVYELIWRDYFKFLSSVQGESFFTRQGLRTTPIEYQASTKTLEAWKNGTTGVDFVDAHMRELLKTGWMSNRGRQNVASYLAKTLRLDWLPGAEWFETQLIDEDPENNFGNWQYLAGVGTDPRDRIFNIQRQAEMYDAQGAYRAKWLS